MANAVTAYRDMPLADRNTDAGFAALFPYLQEAQPPPAPLPPLEPARRVGSQNLPPVKTLLTQQEEWAQTKQNSEGKGTQNGAETKVLLHYQFQLSKQINPMSNASETAVPRSPDRPLKRGPKGPRKLPAPRPLGPLKLIAPKLVEKTEEEDITPKNKQKKPTSKRALKRADKRGRQPNQTGVETTGSSESMATVTLLDPNPPPEIDISQSFNIPAYNTLGSGLLGSASGSIDSSTSGISNQSPTFPNLQQTPMDLQNHNQNTLMQVAALAYNSPQTNFSPISDNASTFAQIYHSPVFPTSHSTHVSPHSAMSPLHSMQNSPHTFRSNLDPMQGLQSPVPQLALASPSQIYPTRLANGNDQSPDLIGVDGQFHSPVDFVDPSSANILNGSAPTSKRKRGQEKLSDIPNGKRKTIKPRTAVTAIQSVLNPAHDGRVDVGPPSPLHPKSRNASPKKSRLPLPNTPTSPHHLRLSNESSMTNTRLILPPGPTSGMNNGYTNPSPSLIDEQSRQFDLSTNSLAMVLNSEHGSSLASPQLYDFSPLDPSNPPQTDILPNSNPREMNGRLPVQSLLTLPPLQADHSPSMQVMQIQPSLLDQSSQLQSMDLDQRRLGRANDTNDPFDMRMTETHFGSQLADVVGSNLQAPSSWADMLLQPTNATPYSTEMATAPEPLFDSNQLSRMDEPPTTVNIRYTESHSSLQQPLPNPPPRKNIPQPRKSPADKRKRKGKQARYVAVEGKNGEPDKTHVDVLVTVIQKSETNGAPNTHPPIQNAHLDTHYETMPSMDDVSLVMSQNSLPSLETLQLVDATANPSQTAQGRNILDEMAGIPSSTEQSYNMMDLFSQEMPDWGTELFPPQSSTQVPMQVRYPPWNQQPEYPESSSSSSAPVAPPAPPPPAKRGRKSKRDREREALERAREADVAAAERRKATPFVCPHPGCTARFRQSEHLKVHLHTHEGIKPFKCDFEGCEKTFSQKGNLKVPQMYRIKANGVGTSEETYGREAICVS